MNNFPTIGPGALPALGNYLRQTPPRRVFVLADRNTARDCYPLAQPQLPAGHQLIEIEAGEAYKTLSTCDAVWCQLTEAQADRHAVLVCLGGGVVTDLGGFVAAAYKRGIACVAVPTTLLAQVDAAVGGKTGVDFQGFKNQIGVFREPDAVFIAPEFLHTLPARELRAGYAEVVKHALIADADAFRQLQALPNLAAVPDWTDLIRHSVAIKQRIVADDPHEAGPRKLLNFGHTVGHALESYLLVQAGREVLHGEAVAAGLVCESWLSAERGLLAAAELKAVEELVLRTFGKAQFVSLEAEGIAALAAQDKKNRGGQINCTLLHGLGRGVYDQAVSEAELAASLRYYHRLGE